MDVTDNCDNFKNDLLASGVSHSIWVTFLATLPVAHLVPRIDSQAHSFNSGLFQTGPVLCPLPLKGSHHTEPPSCFIERATWLS